MRDVRRNGEGRGLCGGHEKERMGCFPGRPQNSRHQHRSVDDCSPGRGRMAQNGRTGGGIIYGEIDRCRESQAGLRHAVVCPNREREGPRRG